MIKYLLGTTKRKLQNRYSVMQDTEEFKRKIAEVGKTPWQYGIFATSIFRFFRRIEDSL